jgi:hypothetical protein
MNHFDIRSSDLSVDLTLLKNIASAKPLLANKKEKET